MNTRQDKGLYDDADFIVFSRPLEVGTELIYYSRDSCLNIAASVKAATIAFIWVVDKEKESEVREHIIAYSDIVKILSAPPGA